MKILAMILISITAILHCLFFKIESIDFMNKQTLKRFGLNDDQGLIVKVWAFNQGFYNLFLAFGLFFSLFLFSRNNIESGKVLAEFILLLITGAGIVLYISSPKKYSAAILQSLPAFLGYMAVLNF